MNPICVRGLPGSESRLWRIALQALVSMPEDAEWEDTSITKKYTGGWGARTLGPKGQGVGIRARCGDVFSEASGVWVA